MAISTSSILNGPTISISGGTAKTLALTETKKNGAVVCVDTSVTDPRLVPKYTYESAMHQMLADGSFTKARRQVQVTRPKQLASGKIDFPTGEVMMKLHPEMSDAEILALKCDLIQQIWDSEYDNFWKFGSKA